MLQADKITVEEGDKRLLDSFSLYVHFFEEFSK